jgi:hypothetical protein
MECDFDLSDWRFPSLLLGKGATIRAAQARGLHSVLRLLFVAAASNLQIPDVSGIVFEGAPRTPLMRAMGYKLSPAKRFWFTDLIPLVPTLIARLDSSEYSTGIRILQEHVNIADYSLSVDVDQTVARQLAGSLPQSPAETGY